jgi:hypothetical protein
MIRGAARRDACCRCDTPRMELSVSFATSVHAIERVRICNATANRIAMRCRRPFPPDRPGGSRPFRSWARPASSRKYPMRATSKSGGSPAATLTAGSPSRMDASGLRRFGTRSRRSIDQVPPPSTPSSFGQVALAEGKSRELAFVGPLPSSTHAISRRCKIVYKVGIETPFFGPYTYRRSPKNVGTRVQLEW